jgi:hypothetical protein
MIILADESVDNGIVLRLREDGHEVSYVAEMSPGILDEAEIISHVIAEHGDKLLQAFSVITERAVRIRKI